MPDPKDILIGDFDYPLPEERIPKHPEARRDACRLLVHAADGSISHRRFSEIDGLIPAGSLIVRNNARVINARMRFRKPTGAEVEIFLLEPLLPADYALTFQSVESCEWSCLVGNLKRWKEGPLEKTLEAAGRTITLRATRAERLPGNAHRVRFEWNDPQVSFGSVVEAAGFIPIPPYLNRASESCDATDYQTVYSRVEGSVAAPTAGLHFTPETFEALRLRGCRIADLTLHVGAGTFQPVKCDSIGDHSMHNEFFSVSRSTLEALIEARREGRPVVAVGTTSVRTLESIPYLGRRIALGNEPHVAQWEPYAKPDFNTDEALEALIAYMESEHTDAVAASTSIMIAPGFRWRMTDILVTNFHQPHSTLLLLVASHLDRCGTNPGEWRRVYGEALREPYRFLSYGDACLLFPLDK